MEQRSLPAFWNLVKCWPAAWQRRREIMRRRRVPDAELMRWFRYQPVSEPLTAEVPEEARAAVFAPDAA